MTAEQFDNHAWRKSDKVRQIGRSKSYQVKSFDKEKRIVGIEIHSDITWLYHSEIELANKLEK